MKGSEPRPSIFLPKIAGSNEAPEMRSTMQAKPMSGEPPKNRGSNFLSLPPTKEYEEGKKLAKKCKSSPLKPSKKALPTNEALDRNFIVDFCCKEDTTSDNSKNRQSPI